MAQGGTLDHLKRAGADRGHMLFDVCGLHQDPLAFVLAAGMKCNHPTPCRVWLLAHNDTCLAACRRREPCEDDCGTPARCLRRTQDKRVHVCDASGLGPLRANTRAMDSVMII